MKLCECGCGKEPKGKYSKFCWGHSNKKRICSPETKEKMSRSKTGKIPWNKGKKNSPESNLKNSLSNMGRRHSKESILKMVQSNTGKKKSQETRKKLSDSHRTEEYRIKYEQSNINGCGFKNPSSSPTIKEKKRLKSQKHYETDFPFQAGEVKDQIKQTMLKNHNVEYPMQSKECQEKARQTNLRVRNVEYPMQDPKAREKYKQTLLKNTGYENPSQSLEVKEKKKQTYKKHYDSDNWNSSQQGRQFHRIIAIKYVEKQAFNGLPLMPRIGDGEYPFFDELQKYTQYKIIRQEPKFRYVVGRVPDGHISELKLFIQFDEVGHFKDKETCKIYKEDDINCTLQLASCGYLVFRISELQWKENKEEVIDQFKILTENLNE